MRGDSEPTRGGWRLWGAEELAQGTGREVWDLQGWGEMRKQVGKGTAGWEE